MQIQTRFVSLALIISCIIPANGAPLNGFVFSQDYLPGTRDVDGNYLSGTEIMAIVAHAGKLYAGNGFWNDQPGPDPSPGAQILVKERHDSPWALDHSFARGRIGCLKSIRLTTDRWGQPLDPPVSLLLASPQDLQGQASVWIRHDSNSLWHETLVGPYAKQERSHAYARMLVDHVDKVTGIHHVFAGTAMSALYRGAYDPNRHTLVWEAEPELVGTERMHSGAVANNTLYMAVGSNDDPSDRNGGLYRRIDGPSPRWRFIFEWDALPAKGPGLRGLTAVPDPEGGKHEVLIGALESTGVILRVDPSQDHRVEIEYDYKSFFTDLWGSLGGRATLAAYNDMTPIVDPETGRPARLIGLFINHPQKVTPPHNGSHYLVRYDDGTYTWGRVFDEAHPVPEGSLLRGTRSIAVSPFPDNQEPAVYMGGFDAAGGPWHNTAWIYRGTLPTSSEPPSGYTEHLNIPYDRLSGVSPQLLSLDLYIPQNTKPDAALPLIVYVHGGGWSVGDKSRVAYKPTLFTEQGYIFASINYRLSPNPADFDDPEAIRFPVHYHDCARALKWLVDNAETHDIDPNRIGITGHSAGAHIVALLATDETYLNTAGLPLSTVQATVTLDAGGLDMPFYLGNAGPGLTATYANAFSFDPNTWMEASPITHVQSEKGIGAFMMIHQNVENRILTHNRFIRHLDMNDIPYERLIAAGYSHGDINRMVGAPEDDLITAPIVNFFDRYLKPESVQSDTPPPLVQYDIPYHEVAGVAPNLLSLDIHSPQTPASAKPVLMMVHGGGWRKGDKSSFGRSPIVDFFTGHGFVVANINYRLTSVEHPEVKHPTHIEDVARAFAWIQTHIGDYGGDPCRVSILGHSAGAHLVALLATNGDYLAAQDLGLDTLKACIPLDVVGVDMPATVNPQTGMSLLYQNAFGTNAADWIDASPALQVTFHRGVPPFFLAYSGENPLFADEASTLATALQTAGVSHRLYPALDRTHSTLARSFGDPDDASGKALAETVLAFLQPLLQ